MAKVILVDSPSWGLFDPRMHIHLGLVYLAGSLRRAGHEIQIVDCHKLTSWDGEKLVVHEELLEACDILGVSASSANVNWGGQLARAWQNAKVKVLGGPHVTHVLCGLHKRFKKKKYFSGFDYLLAGECEETLVQFCDRWEKDQVCNKEIPGLAWFSGTGELFFQHLPALPDVKKLALPAFDLWQPGFSKGALTVRTADGKEINADDRMSAGICTARGCPYDCAFCADARTPVREEDLFQIRAIIRQLKALGVRAVRIQDDSFTLKEVRARAIGDILHDEGMLWRAMTRVNLTNPDFFRYVANSGCTEMGFGVEHSSAKMLKAMNKGTTSEMNARCIKACQDAGIIAHAFIILGFPGETQETISELRRWLVDAHPDSVTLARFQPFPGCDVWAHPEKYGVSLPDDPFGKFWQVGQDDDPEMIVLDLPTISKRELFEARCSLAAWINENLSPLDRTAKREACL